MFDSGGIRTNIGANQNITPYEDRTLRFVAVDENGDAVANFTNWEVDFFWLTKLTVADGVDALALAADFVRTEITATPIDLGTVPNIDVPLRVADWTSEMVGRTGHAFEVWRTDAGNVRRLAYGEIEVVR